MRRKLREKGKNREEHRSQKNKGNRKSECRGGLPTFGEKDRCRRPVLRNAFSQDTRKIDWEFEGWKVHDELIGGVRTCIEKGTSVQN